MGSSLCQFEVEKNQPCYVLAVLYFIIFGLISIINLIMSQSHYFLSSSLNPPSDFVFFKDSGISVEKEMGLWSTDNIAEVNCNGDQRDQKSEKKYFKTLELSKPQPVKLLPRKKNYIQVNQKTKKSYLSAKKGDSSETNQLTINVHTIMKSILSEMTIFLELSDYELEKIRIFRESKPNIAALRNLLCSELLNDQKDGQKQTLRMGNIRSYLAQKLRSTDTLESVLSSKKMGMRNKLTIIKYINNLLEACQSPSKFSLWKRTSP